MDILIIGGAGYTGSHVTRQFSDQGRKVTVFANLSAGFGRTFFRTRSLPVEPFL
ncbi:MAG: NAD-dependent epimerase/dehydratase family protein [Treponema sp.]|nr:NAD-dependent epimerase/dehydratase family protein [Treponema sp.]